MIYVRKFNLGDENAIYQLFYDAVHEINKQDYTSEQLDVWAPKFPDLSVWKKRLSNSYTLVAVDSISENIVGFIGIEKTGYLDHIYVHKDYQNMGIAKLLLLEIEKKAQELGLNKLFSDVSITAKPAMEKLGFVSYEQKTRDKGGVVFIQYAMVKEL